MTKYCNSCKEMIVYTSVLRHDTHSKPIEQEITPSFCPICGHELQNGKFIFLLISTEDYPDDLYIAAKDPEDLEEIMLSLYEEDFYDWFCVLNEEAPQNISFENIFTIAKQKAITMNNLCKIKVIKEF